ncbi:MAG: zinc ribbon domain-containing protein [Rhodospirillaceae bacterium]|nr:zinc ribbon domain-containing protein [Rhodospirillaceae bacterium]
MLECGVCGGPYAMRGQGRYGCYNHVMTGSCANGRSIRRLVIEERVLARLKDKLMAPEAAAEAMKAYVEETNRLNRERRASGATDRATLAEIEKKIKAMVAVIEDGSYARGMMDRMRELEARQDESAERLSAVLADPRDRDEAAEAIRGLIERIVLTPGEKRGEMHAALHGDLGTILEWAESGRGKRVTDF